jgi:hypothetical protein
MNVETSIGENYHFELHDTLLVYQGRGTSFVTRHEVTLSKSAPRVLGPAQPLTVSFIDALVRSVGGNVKAEILPENVLAKGDRMIAWCDAAAATGDVLQELRGQGETPQREGLPAAAAGVACLGREPADSGTGRTQAPGRQHKARGRAVLESV